ncbi:hypothetical protein TanjilG_19360 [Lupinus angustifolius]|uniref:AP2/ERF domain-containing protein n=1 Tax=Lupinus angustifolius TaxID=3871 RepID=A0A1J7GRB6_LUPAN|nr:hypothetical protein TanjilG_19360 [Lupinus angustifolius]
MDENMDSPFQNHDWNLINSHSSNEILEPEDFLGVRSSENQSDILALNEIQSNDSDYLFTNNNFSVTPIQNSLVAATNLGNYEYQENNMQPLTLSTGNVGNNDSTNQRSGDNNTNNAVQVARRNSLQYSRQRKSIYRGVSRHISTGKYEAHIWDSSIKREGKSKSGFQGGYDTEEKAARAHDLAALKYWGESTITNFPIGNYEKELEEMKNMTKKDFVAAIRRKSTGFRRGASPYRGVTKHSKNGKWQAKIGRVDGHKDLYLGTYSTEEEAAEAYDIAAIKFRGPNAVTNFDINRYDVKSIVESNTLPLKGGAIKILQDTDVVESSREREEMTSLLGSSSTSNVLGHGYPLQNRAMPCYNNTNEYTQVYNLSYVQTQLELYQKQQNGSYNGRLNNNQIQNHPTLLQGYMNIGSSSSSAVMHNNGGGSSDWSYNGVGFIGNNNNGLVGMTSKSSSSLMVNDGIVGMASNSSSSNAKGLSFMVDYDLASEGYSGWLMDSFDAPNA